MRTGPGRAPRRRQIRRWNELPSERPRVLIECEEHDSPDLVADALSRAGYDTAVCTGPGPNGACELLDGGACALIDEADVVVNMLAPIAGDPIATTAAALRRPPAIVRELRHGELVGAADAPAMTHLRTPVTADGLLDAIRRALDTSRRDGPPWGIGV